MMVEFHICLPGSLKLQAQSSSCFPETRGEWLSARCPSKSPRPRRGVKRSAGILVSVRRRKPDRPVGTLLAGGQVGSGNGSAVRTFDAFTEISADGGAVWSPNDGSPSDLVNSHGTPGVDVAAFGFNPAGITATASRVVPTPHLLQLRVGFKNGGIPSQENLAEDPDGMIDRGLDLRLPSAGIVPPEPGTAPRPQSVDIILSNESRPRESQTKASLGRTSIRMKPPAAAQETARGAA
jgi:hypothetical protein